MSSNLLLKNPIMLLKIPMRKAVKNKQSIKLLITDTEFFIKTVMSVMVKQQEEVPLHLISLKHLIMLRKVKKLGMDRNMTPFTIGF